MNLCKCQFSLRSTRRGESVAEVTDDEAAAALVSVLISSRLEKETTRSFEKATWISCLWQKRRINTQSCHVWEHLLLLPHVEQDFWLWQQSSPFSGSERKLKLREHTNCFINYCYRHRGRLASSSNSVDAAVNVIRPSAEDQRFFHWQEKKGFFFCCCCCYAHSDFESFCNWHLFYWGQVENLVPTDSVVSLFLCYFEKPRGPFWPLWLLAAQSESSQMVKLTEAFFIFL